MHLNLMLFEYISKFQCMLNVIRTCSIFLCIVYLETIFLMRTEIEKEFYEVRCWVHDAIQKASVYGRK